MWEKKGKKVQSGLVPVLYESAIEVNRRRSTVGKCLRCLTWILGGLPRFSGGRSALTMELQTEELDRLGERRRRPI